MDFNLTPSQQMSQKSVREFVRKEVVPLSQQLDENNEFPVAIYRQALALDVLDLTVPETLGGMGEEPLSFVMALEEFAWGSPALAHSIAASEAILYLLSRYGSNQQQDRYLPALMAGEIFGAAAVWRSEAVTGPAAPVRAVQAGDGYRLNGTLNYVPFATAADLAVVFAAINDNVNDHGNDITAVILDKQTPGWTASETSSLMGVRGFPLGRIDLNDVAVSEEHLLGGGKTGREIFDDLLRRCETAAAAIAVGLSRAAMESAVRHSKARIQFGKSLAEMEATQNKIADMAAGIQSARLLVYHAAISLEKAASAGPQSAMAKLTASELAVGICREAVQIHGGYGYVKDYPVERLYRDALFSQIYPTVNEAPRRIIARHTLRTKR